MEKEKDQIRLIENVIDDMIRLFKRCVKGLVLIALGCFMGYYYHQYHLTENVPNTTINYNYTKQVLVVLPSSLPSTGANQ